MAKKIYNDLINPQIKPNDLDLSMFNKPDELDLSMFDSVKKNEDSDSTSEVRVSASKESTSIDFNAPPPVPKFEKEALGQPPVDEQSVDYLTPEQTKRRTDTVSALKEQLPFIQKTIADIDAKAKVNIGGNVVFGFGKEQGDLLTARRYLKSAEKLINSPTEEGIKSFWAGLKRNDLTNLLSLGSTEAYRSIKTANIANKIKNGEEPTDEEYLVMTGRFMYDIANQSIDSPSSYRIGQAFAEMAPFIGQLYVSAPIGAAASKAAASTTTKVLSKEAVNILKKYGIDDVLKVATQAAAQTPFTPMLFQKYGEERMPSLSVNDEGKVIPVEGGESRVEAVADAFGSTMSSIFSEKVGEVIKGRVTNWGKKAAIAMDDPSKALSSIQKFRKDANWSGLGYEFAEEQIDGVGQAIATEEATLSDLLDSKRQFETLATIMVAGGVMKAVEIPGYFKTKQYKKDLDKATEYFRSKVDPHTAEVVDAAVNTDDVDQMRERLQNEDLSYLQPEQQKDVLDYMKAKIENNVLFEAANTKLEKDENGKVIQEKGASEDITPPKEDNASTTLLDTQEIKKPEGDNEGRKDLGTGTSLPVTWSDEKFDALALEGGVSKVGYDLWLTPEADLTGIVQKHGNFVVRVKDNNGYSAEFPADVFAEMSQNQTFSDRVRSVSIVGEGRNQGVSDGFMRDIRKDNEFILTDGSFKEINLPTSVSLTQKSTVSPKNAGNITDAINDKVVNSLLVQLGIKEIVIERPGALDISDQGLYNSQEKKIILNADIENPKQTILHELAHERFMSLSNNEKDVIRNKAKNDKRTSYPQDLDHFIIDNFYDGNSYYKINTKTKGDIPVFIKGDIPLQNIQENAFDLREKQLSLQYELDKQNKGSDSQRQSAGVEYPRTDSSRPVEGKPRFDVGGNRLVDAGASVKEFSLSDKEATDLTSHDPDWRIDKSFTEIKDANLFTSAISESKKGNPFSASVWVYTPEEYAKSRLFLTNDGKAGAAITQDGTIISVFSHGDGKGRAPQLVVNAIKEGGVKLDHYNTILTKYYSKFGFVPVAKVKFDPELAPSDWNKETYKKFNNGEPDVVLMAYHGGDPNTLSQRVGKFGDYQALLEKAPYVKTFEEGQKLQEEYVKKVKEQNALNLPQGEQVPESKEPVQEVKTDPEIALKLRDFAAKIRQGKISRIEGFKANTPFSLAWDGALEVLATTLDTTADITVAVNKAMTYIKDTDWYKGLSLGRRKEFEDKFIDHINKESGLVTEGEPRVSGIKKSLVPQEMVDATDIDRKSNIEMLERGKQLIESGEIDGTTLVQDIVKKPRALQQEEVASLVYYKAKLDNSFDEVYDKWEAAKNSDNIEQQQEMQVRLDAIRKQIDDYHEMSLQTAYEQSRAFGLRKMLLDNEYTLQTQVKKYKAANNGEIPVEVEQKFRDYEKQLEEVNKKLRDLERRKMETEGNDVLQAIKRSAGRPTRKQGKALAAEGFQDLMQALGAMKMAAQTGEKSVTVVDALGKIGRGLIDEGVATLDNVISKIKDYISNKYKGNVDIDGISDDIMKSIREYKGKPEIVDGKLKMPKDIIKDYVEQGYDDINEIVSAIKDDFQLEATDREIRDAITEYGKTLKMSQEDIDLKVRELKRMGKTISGLEDVINEKKKPLRSGLQRDKLTDRERRLQKELREAMKELPLSEEESLAEWKSALDAVKSRLRNQIEDLQHQIETGEKAPSRKGIEYDAEAEALREQRDALKETLEELMGKEEISDEQKVRMALASTERWITEYERRISEKDFSPLSQRRNVPVTEELEAAKKRLADIKKAYKDMLDVEGETERRRLARYKDAIFRQTANYAKRLREKDFAPRQKVEPPKADRDALELLALKTKIKEKFDTEVEKARLANRPLSAKINENLIDVANLPKSLIASADLSAPLRQGVILGAAHPTKVPGAFKEMFLQAFSSKRADKWLNHIKVNPDFHIIRQSKLYISEDSTRLRAKEEQFMTNIGHKIPIWGRVVSGSERAYTGYLNKLRVDVFLQGVDHLKKQGLDPTKDSEAYKAWADFVNNASGRGNLGILEGAAPVLNATFFSPRLIASRFNLLNPVKYINMPTEVRKMALRDMGAFIGFGVMVLAIAKASGAEVEDDPRSSDFGKIKIGNLRFDIWAGFQQPVVMFSRLATGETKSSTSGRIRELSPKEYPFTTRADVVRRFFRSKMSPTAALGADLLQGETMMGEELDAGKMALERVIPLYLQDMKEIKDELGVKGMVGAGIPSLFGVGVQYYEPKPSKTNN